MATGYIPQWGSEGRRVRVRAGGSGFRPRAAHIHPPGPGHFSTSGATSNAGRILEPAPGPFWGYPKGQWAHMGADRSVGFIFLLPCRSAAFAGDARCVRDRTPGRPVLTLTQCQVANPVSSLVPLPGEVLNLILAIYMYICILIYIYLTLNTDTTCISWAILPAFFKLFHNFELF